MAPAEIAPVAPVNTPNLADKNGPGPVITPVADTSLPLAPKLTATPLDKGDACSLPPGGTDNFGTAVAFVASPKVAGKLAAAQDKLMFVLHISGNFEDSGFT
jgi:hypothetical protein